MSLNLAFLGCLVFCFSLLPNIVKPSSPDNPRRGILEQCGSSDPDYDNEVKITDDLNMFYSVVDTLEGGALSVHMVYKKLGWIGWGVSTSGTMVGNGIVIGMPLQSSRVGNPGKYDISGYSGSTIVLLEDSFQTLINASLVQDETTAVTNLTFTKLLEDTEELAIDLAGSNKFIYAVGSNNFFAYHAKKGSFTLDLSIPCSNDVIIEGGGGDMKSFWVAHGALAFIAWSVAAPIAIISVLSRQIIGAPLWFQIHRTLNALCIALSLLTLIIAVVAKSKGSSNPKHFRTVHHIVGLCVVIVATFQVVAAYFRPHVSEGEKSPMRKVWQILHRSFGIILLVASIFQVHSGIELYIQRFGGQWSMTFYWVWIGILLAAGVGSKIYFVFKKEDPPAPEDTKA